MIKKYGAIILILGLGFYLAYMLLSQDAVSKTGQDAHEPQDQGAQNAQSDQRDQRVQRDQNDAGAETGNQKAVEQKKIDFSGNEGGGEDVEDENYFADDQEIFARKLYQKKLAPLSEKEKIIWAFRLSKTTIFL
jgi:DNA-directed RNA polymerase specialized sigma subunit